MSARNLEILRAALNGDHFVDLAKRHRISAPRIREIIMKQFKRLAPDMYKEGLAAGDNGCYATPSIFWMRRNKDRLLSVIYSTLPTRST